MPDCSELPHPRQATGGDAAGITALVNAAYSGYSERMGKTPAPMLADYAALIAEGDVHILESEGCLKAVLVMRADGDGLFLGNIAVAPAFQGQGLGRGLMRFVEASALRQGLPAVHLYTNEAMTENIAFYSRLGFEEAGRRLEDGYRRVFFRKRIAAGR